MTYARFGNVPLCVQIVFRLPKHSFKHLAKIFDLATSHTEEGRGRGNPFKF